MACPTPTTTAQEDPAPRDARRPRGPHGAVRRLGHAGRVLRHHRRAHGGAHARRAVRRQPHGRDRDRRQGRARGGAAHHRATTRRSCRSARRSTPALHDARGHVRRRPARLPAGARRTSCSSSTPATSTKDYAWIADADRRRSATSAVVNSSSRYALIARAGPEGARASLQPLTGVDLDGDQVLLVRARRGRRRPRHGVAHRLHRRGRLRDLRAAGSRPTACGRRCSQAGEPRGLDPVRPRRARHAAPRSRDAPLRQRHRRDDDACSRPTWAGSSAGRRTTFIGARRAARAEGRAASRASSSASR